MADDDVLPKQEMGVDIPRIATDSNPGSTEDEAAQELFGLLSGPGEEEEDTGPAEEAGARGEDDPSPETEADESEAVEAEEEAVEGDDLGEQTDEDEGEDESETSDSDLPQTVTVKVDGEEQEVPLEEAVAGYQRQEAFTRKTQELAEQRRELRSEAEQVRAERQEYAERLGVVEDVLGALQPEKPDSELARTKPQEYSRQLAEYEERQQQIEAVQAERQQAFQQTQEEMLEVQQERLAEERELLQAKIPEMVDPDREQEILQQMAETAQSEYGFSPEMLGQVVDHRPLHVLYDAMKYRELKEKGDEVTSSGSKKSSKTLKPGSSGSKQKKSKKTSRKLQSARKRLANSGSVDDAAKVLLEAIEE